jgi:hypothetical protein
MMKRGKLFRKSLSNLISHHPHSKNVATATALLPLHQEYEYEFSCSNSPAPLFFFHVSKRKHHYFPCINDHQVIEEEEPQEPKAITLIYKNE